MKRNTLLVLLFCGIAFASCEKEPVVAPEQVVVPSAPVTDITAPEDFNWSNSRNVNFFLYISSARFSGVIHLISIYEGDPADGKLLGKGSVTDQAMFKCTLFLPSQLKNVTIVCTAPDNSKATQKLAIPDGDVVNTKLAML